MNVMCIAMFSPGPELHYFDFSRNILLHCIHSQSDIGTVQFRSSRHKISHDEILLQTRSYRNISDSTAWFKYRFISPPERGIPNSSSSPRDQLEGING